ncbi:hypothetical protein OS493_024074 [Desmophyllum pertusum]|uniref:Uncharacterized protein n=1 Tax=Desmophyllum pertusum TaxID=174260 RepID=A0A9X0D233_9CNID|nr:hypothetical protein OS493_024074 [Desmophyllum pertusum]
MRWKLNYFKRSLNQASVRVRTLCSSLFTRDHEVTFGRNYGVTLSNLFTPINRRASGSHRSFECSCSSLCNQWHRAFSLEMSSDNIKLLICGSGNGAHAFAGIASSLKGTDVRVLSLYQDEAERWSAAMQKRELEVTLHLGLPGEPGLDFQVRHVLGETGRQCTIMNFESLPWACRTTEFGVKCEILGTKETLLGAMKKGENVAQERSSFHSTISPWTPP